MTKEETIKNAWGEHYEINKELINEYGWLRHCKKTDIDTLEFIEENKDIFDYRVHNTPDAFLVFHRPKSLQGIENNNGWNIITDDLEFTTETFWLYNSSNVDMFRGRLFDDDKLPIHRYATHYQQIEKPKLPIY